MTSYGMKGGEGPTRGRKATTYSVTLPDGTVIKKRTFFDKGETAIATADTYQGKTIVAVWPGEPAWEGNNGRLVAHRI